MGPMVQISWIFRVWGVLCPNYDVLMPVFYVARGKGSIVHVS